MELIVGLTVLIYSAILHEIAHGYVADRLGDPTARLMGRLTLNPKPHIDPYWTILLPALMWISSHGAFVIGGAKPVPVDPFNLQEGRKDMALVSLAGPLTNILLAITAAILFKVLYVVPFLGDLLTIIAYYNLLLGIFNLVPIPPLDGSKIFALLLPEQQAAAYLSIGSMGMLFIVFLFVFPIGGFSLGDSLFRLVHFGLNALGF